MKSCKECGNERCLLNATEGYCLDCPECGVNWKEKKMEFDKSRCYTSLNADELKAGDKVIAACAISTLKRQIETDSKYIKVREIYRIADDKTDHRFRFKDGGQPSAPFAYLVERARNCTNCGKIDCSAHSEHDDFKVAVCSNWIPKAEPKTEQKAEKKYRPFKDTDELIKVWCDKGGKWQKRELTMPHIWVRDPKRPKVNYLLNGLMGNEVHWGSYIFNMQELFDNFEFLDGTPCGVEE